MSLATPKIFLAGAANTTNGVGAYFETLVVSAVSTGNGTAIPTGIFQMFPTANVSVVAYNGTANATLLANNTGGMVVSDGINVRVLAASGNINVTFMQVNEGQVATNTFIS